MVNGKTGGNVHIEYVALDDLTQWPRNPKDHDIGALHQSVRRFGFVSPILIDETSGRVVAGHGRIDTLAQMRDAGADPPERIREDDGRWLVPVIRGVEFRDEQEAEAYLIADNQHTILGGWDDAELIEMLQDHAVDLDGIGFDADDLDALIRAYAVTPEGEAPIIEMEERYAIIIECQNEEQQRDLIERFMQEGIECRAMIL